MTAKELWELLQGKEGIQSLEETPAGILLELSGEDPIQISVGDGIEYVRQKGNRLELVLSERSTIGEELRGLWNAKESRSLKRILTAVMDALSGSLVPLMPMLISAAMFKTLASVLGPDMLNVLPADSDLYTLFTFVGDAGFYFFPVAVGYTSALVFHVTPILGVFLGGILIHPTFINLAELGVPFSVYGIRITPLNYSSTILPIILSVWIMSE